MVDRISINLLFFGQVREIVGKHRIAMELVHSSRVSQSLATIANQFPMLEKHKLLIAINEEYADADTVLTDGDEVALFTAVSGG